jgi:uncharacterized RDD family membrane protein YckC
MSDQSQGPGWWMTSDGKWYPPHLHPAVIAASQSSSATPIEEGAAESPPPTSSLPPMPPPPAGYPPGYGPPPGHGAMPPPAQNGSVRFDHVVGVVLAPWWKRLVAVMIDGAILGVAYFILVGIIGAIVRGSSNGTTTTTTTRAGGAIFIGFIFIVIIASIPSSIYFGALNGSRRGQTIGKLALGIAVRDARTGGKIGFWRGFARALMWVVFELVVYVPYILDNLAPLWDKRRQAWHDKAVGSIVVDLRP